MKTAPAMPSPDAKHTGVTHAGADLAETAPRAHQVLRNSELLTHILSFVNDKKTWRSVFTIEKAWLPAITQLRCRQASWEVMSWDSDTFWRQCVANSIRSISHTDRTKGYDVARMDSETFAEVDAAFVKFPLLRSVERLELHDFQQSPKASATWTYDPTTDIRELVLHHPTYRTLRGRDGHTIVDIDEFSVLTQLASSEWKVRRSTSVIFSGDDDPLDYDTYPGLRDVRLPSHVTDLVLPYVTVGLSVLIDICKNRSDISHASPLLRLEGALVHIPDFDSFRLLGQTAGKSLRHVHLCYADFDHSDPPEMLETMSPFRFPCLLRIVESVRLHFTRLETLTIPIDHPYTDWSVASQTPRELDTVCPNPLNAISMMVCSRGTSDWPLLSIARNLAYIADGDTTINIKHWDDAIGGWTNRVPEAQIIMDIIRFIRCLPKRHTHSLLTCDLYDLGFGPKDCVSFLRTSFDQDGRPVRQEVQRARERYITVERAWRDADESPDANAQAELNRLRQELEEYDQWSPGWGTDKCASADECQDTRQALKRAEAEIERLKAKLGELEQH